jgi:hypothetical protein
VNQAQIQDRIRVELEKLEAIEKEVEKEVGFAGVRSWIYTAFMTLRENKIHCYSRIYVKVIDGEKDLIKIGNLITIEDSHSRLLPVLLKMFGEVCLQDYGETSYRSVSVKEVIEFLNKKLKEKEKDCKRNLKNAKRNGRSTYYTFARLAEIDVISITKAIEYLQSR